MNSFADSALVLRRRSVWEAVDSGVLLWRNNFVYFIPFFVLPVGIVAYGLHFLPYKLSYLSYLALWWLKPFFDRLVLQVVSRRFFGSPASRFRELRRGLWGMGRGIVGDLLWRRFSPVRAACLPIRVLERIDRKQFRIRKTTLAGGGLNFCSLISVFGLALEGLLLLGEIYFVIIMTDLFLPSVLGYMRDNSDLVGVLIYVAYCLNYVLVESLYVCMGFGLYINSRVEVEGWDLQLLFQRLAGHEKNTSSINTNTNTNNANTNTNSTNTNTNNGNTGAISRTGIIAVLVACFFLALPQAVYAEGVVDTSDEESVEEFDEEFTEDEFSEMFDKAWGLTEELFEEAGEPKEPIAYFPDDFPFADAAALESLENILASPDFGSEKEGWEIRLKKDSSRKTRMPSRDVNSLLEKIRQVSGLILRGFVVLLIAGAVCGALYWFWKNRQKISPLRGKGKSYVQPRLSPESPESLFAKAEDFFRRGNLREAWAACLAGCIGAYTRYRSLAFPANATEYGCLELVRRSMPAEVGGFEELVQSWIFFAYGGRLPGEGAFERALAYGRSLSRERSVVEAQ